MVLAQLKRLWNKPAAPFPVRGVTCHFPLWRFEIMTNGDIYHCCPTWLPHSVANITEVSILDAFRAPASRDVQNEVLEGEFRYCKAELCPHLSRYVSTGAITGPLQSRAAGAGPALELSLERTQRLLVMLNYDASCNLRCPSCRNETILFTEEKAPPLLKQVHEAVQRNIQELRDAGFHLSLNITGSGDAFASPLYSRLLRELSYDPKLSLELQTNGVLMEESRFTEAMFRMTKFLAVSVDAASRPVYEKVRRGGSFERVAKNLDWMNAAIEGGRFAQPVFYKINFIVQQENFREIVPFAKWILGYGAVNEIWFNLIADWGHLPAEEFQARAIWRKDHPEHGDFLAVLRDPVLRDPRICLGNLSTYI